jgi:hypothetical protein
VGWEKHLGHHESEETYLAIGRFIFEFSQLEYEIRYQIAEAINLEEKFIDPILTHDFAMLCTAANEILGGSMVDSKRKRLRDIIGECYALNEDRVRVAHGLWVPFREGGVVHHVSRSRLKPARSVQQAQYLQDKATKANELRFRLSQLTAAI